MTDVIQKLPEYRCQALCLKHSGGDKQHHPLVKAVERLANKRHGFAATGIEQQGEAPGSQCAAQRQRCNNVPITPGIRRLTGSVTMMQMV